MIISLLALSRRLPATEWCPIGKEMQILDNESVFASLLHTTNFGDRYETDLVDLILLMLRKEPRERIKIDLVVSSLKGEITFG